mmetsp:Transcript_21877/g.55707  ORF Transcript_21877/g.55707 Transcript_21877/m.55707 type:complete len:254 (-) Transcript_21877:746-1507(-)
MVTLGSQATQLQRGHSNDDALLSALASWSTRIPIFDGPLGGSSGSGCACVCLGCTGSGSCGCGCGGRGCVFCGGVAVASACCWRFCGCGAAATVAFAWAAGFFSGAALPPLRSSASSDSESLAASSPLRIARFSATHPCSRASSAAWAFSALAKRTSAPFWPMRTPCTSAKGLKAPTRSPRVTCSRCGRPTTCTVRRRLAASSGSGSAGGCDSRGLRAAPCGVDASVDSSSAAASAGSAPTAFGEAGRRHCAP